MTIEEASAKVRNDGPLDLEAGYDTVPIEQRVGARRFPMRGWRHKARPGGKSVISPRARASTGSCDRSLKESATRGLIDKPRPPAISPAAGRRKTRGAPAWIRYHRECVIATFPGDPRTAPPSYRCFVGMVERLANWVRPTWVGHRPVRNSQ
jgi:hypothetical protein